MSGRATEHNYALQGEVVTVRVQPLADGRLEVRIGDWTHTVDVARAGQGFLGLAVDGRRITVHTVRDRDTRLVAYRGSVYRLAAPAPRARRGGAAAADHEGALSAPMPATVVRVAVIPGELVQPNQVLLVLEAMKMAHEIRAPYAGRVASVRAAAGALVEPGAPLVTLEPLDAEPAAPAGAAEGG